MGKMLFTPDQVEDLLNIIRFNHVLFGVDVIGGSVLSPDDINLLSDYGVDASGFSDENMPEFEQAFHFGRLTSAIGNYQSKSVDYSDFRKFVQRGGYRALTDYESDVLEIIKNQSFQAVKGLGNKITGHFSQIVSDNELSRRLEYEEILRDEMKQGIVAKKSIQDIILDLGKRTGDWERDLGRLVETEMHNAFDMGRACQLKERYGSDVMVYKDVYDGACKHCIELYTTDGLGSEPRLFKLSELMSNGTNVGVSAGNWKPVIGSTHPFCRCTLNVVPEGYEWDRATRSFSVLPAGYKFKHEFSVKIKIGDKNYTVQ